MMFTSLAYLILDDEKVVYIVHLFFEDPMKLSIKQEFCPYTTNSIAIKE